MTPPRIKFAVLTGFGLGLLRPAPGTWGSIPPAGLAWSLLITGAPTLAREVTLGVVCIAACAACLAWGAWGEIRLAKKDARQIVADEVAGMCLPLLVWPGGFASKCHAFAGPSIAWDAVARATLAVAVAFLAFRVLDIIKPPPAWGAQRFAGGLGILLDDLIAGLYASIGLQIVLRLI